MKNKYLNLLIKGAIFIALIYLLMYSDSEDIKYIYAEF